MTINQDDFIASAQDYALRWRYESDGDVFFTHSSLLWPVRRGDRPLMLKIVDPDDDEAQAGRFLRALDGRGAVRIVECDGHVQLLERLEADSSVPSLEQMVLDGQDDQATHILCDVVETVHAAVRGIEHVDYLHPFQQRFEDMRRHMDEGRVQEADKPLFQRAYDMGSDLVAETQSSFMPLHGDIHHFNVLHSSERGWLAIDPKGFWGPRVYEYANILCNPCPHQNMVANAQRMTRQAKIVAARSGVDFDLLMSFVFSHAAQCAAWSLSDTEKPYWMACLQTAGKIAGLC